MSSLYEKPAATDETVSLLYQSFSPAAAGPLEKLWQSQPETRTSEDHVAARERAAYAKGFREGRLAAESELTERIEAERNAIVRALTDFDRKRTQLFAALQREAALLAVEVARKVLKREPAVDLQRVAEAVAELTDRLDHRSTVVLRVTPSRLHEWRERLSAQSFRVLVKLEEDRTLSEGQLFLDTELGSADLGIDTELDGLEQRFREVTHGTQLESTLVQ